MNQNFADYTNGGLLATINFYEAQVEHSREQLLRNSVTLMHAIEAYTERLEDTNRFINSHLPLRNIET